MSTHSNKLDGKIALITGGSTGIGLATAQHFVAEGAYVFITGRRKAELNAAAKQIGSNVTAVQGDVANPSDLDRLFAIIKEEKGRLDVLFANAGGAQFTTFGSVTEEEYDQSFDINVKGLFFTVQKALPLLTDGASVLLNASITSSKGFEKFSVYNATKAAVRSFARSWTNDLKARKIRVNAISPGPIETRAMEGLTSTKEEFQQFKDNFAAAVPLGRVGQPDEIAKVAVFLASDDSSYVAGIELFVDGGMIQV
jgi:NAD(P)-dependent dehydrogenase (short-subunit alcohol dehydrogenase family)